MLSFKELITVRHKVFYVELTNKEEEKELCIIMKNLKGLNSVLGKPIHEEKSPEYEYYIGVCHEKRKQYMQAKVIFYNSAQKGCITSWLALALLCSWEKEIKYKLKAYELGEPHMTEYIKENVEEFVTSIYTLVVSGKTKYLPSCVKICNDYKNSDMFSLLGTKRVKARKEDISKLKSLLVEVESWLQEPIDDPDYIIRVVNPEEMVIQELLPYAERECQRVLLSWL